MRNQDSYVINKNITDNDNDKHTKPSKTNKSFDTIKNVLQWLEINTNTSFLQTNLYKSFQ